MNQQLYTIYSTRLNSITDETIKHAVTALETGQILFCPHYPFIPNTDEKALLSESVLNPKQKNISYDYLKSKVSGLSTSSTPETSILMSSFMHRFAEYAQSLVTTLLPQYSNDLSWGRTSYRPAEIRGRKTSKRKDDTRVHVDAFSSTPVYGLRILRVFCNINPYGKPRSWDIGEPLNQVIHRFSDQIPQYNATRAKILHWLKATKTLRSSYDHLMLHLHDKMKLNDQYQQSIKKIRIDFPAESTWVVFTDSVSHAALGGQFLLEQTFYLPINAMENPDLSPLKIWEKVKSEKIS